ncbi:hypothetical protein ACIRLA_34830 [Streptomyces sp. NPDC102364]|uniref:hypothetical protein n=1 Tax=Streptomyces sp. NPDC102364 TaxID=3366161 RepID=UPI0038001270
MTLQGQVGKRLEAMQRAIVAEQYADRCLAQSADHLAAAEVGNFDFNSRMSVVYLGMAGVHQSAAIKQRHAATIL